MNHNWIHPDQLEQNDITREAMLEALLSHRITAVFDDNSLAVKFANVRQCLGQYFGFDFRSNRRGGHGARNSGEVSSRDARNQAKRRALLKNWQDFTGKIIDIRARLIVFFVRER
jgi:hypothetical protein